MNQYHKLMLVHPKLDSLDNELEQVLMKYHNYDIDLSGFGEVEAPYFEDIETDLKQAISIIAKSHKIDFLIQENHETDEGSTRTFYIFKKEGTIIEGTSIDEFYGCSFEYSEDSINDEDEEFEEDEEGFFDEDRKEEIMEKCAIEVYQFCRHHGLDVTQELIDKALNTYW